MHKVKYYLIILPLIYFAVGAYFHQINGLPSVRGADPEYIFLANALNIANGNMKVGNIDHPGIPYDYMLAASLRITHFFRISNGPFNQDVLANPDMYLRVANLVSIMLIVVVMFLSGYLALKITGSIWLALIVQFTPFATDILYGDIGRIPTEIFVPIPLAFLTVLLLKHMDRNEEKTPIKDILLFAAVSTFALSLKLTLAPLLMIPFFLIRPLKSKIYYVLAVLVMFLVFAWPVTLQLKYFWNWMKSIVLYSGQYGQGEKNVLDVEQFWPNVINLYRANKLYFIFTFIAFVSFISSFFAPRKSRPERNTRIIAITALAVVAILVFALGKQYKTPYFIPALMLLPLLVILTIRFVGCWLPEKFKRFVAPFYVLLVMVLLLNSHLPVIRSLSVHFVKQNQQKMQAVYFLRLVEKESVKIILPAFYGAPTPEYAIMNTYQWAGKYRNNYHSALAELYPDTYLFFPWDKTLYFWGEPIHIDGTRPVYLYYERLSQKEEFAASYAEFIPEYLEWEQVFYNPETEEVIFRLNGLNSQNGIDSD
jgi:hypothetical protein